MKFDHVLHILTFDEKVQYLDQMIPAHTQKLQIIIAAHVDVKIIHVQASLSPLENIEIICHADSRITYYFFCVHAARLELKVILQESGAYAEIRGAYALNQDASVTLLTLQDHRAPHARSDLLVQGVLCGNTRAQYDGTINVVAGAHGTQATQHNATIMLSETARSFSKPTLEIVANDVQCKHGSAVGQLDEEHLFYVTSRGISAHNAQQLLLSAFFERVTGNLPELEKNYVQDMLLKQVDGKEL